MMVEPPAGRAGPGPKSSTRSAPSVATSIAIVEQDMYPCAPDKPLPIARRTYTYLAGCSSARVSIGTQTGGPA